MTEVTNELASVFDVVDFSKIFMFVFIPILTILILI